MPGLVAMASIPPKVTFETNEYDVTMIQTSHKVRLETDTLSHNTPHTQRSSPSISIMTTLGTASAQAIALITQLREAGADLDFDLPRLLFVGKQSAGKSSLVEALTGIALPRAHRTCTRCPIEVVTTKKGLKKDLQTVMCEISLRVVSSENSVVVVHPVCCVEVTEDVDVATLIQDAQTQLLGMNDDGLGQQLFTKNAVIVQISGPNCEDLALVDLPGLIQSQEEKENEVYIERVEGLVREYMEKENTVIVQCIASDEDVENQKIFTLARNADPEGLRTIGVLTKPDKIEKGTEDDIVAILSGKTYNLAKGFFVVRNPNKEELDSLRSSKSTTYGKGREIETKFFESHDIGRKLHKASPERCGSTNLLKQLSMMLKLMIDEQVPLIKKMAQELVENTKTQLDDLGKVISVSESRRALNDAIRDFSAMSSERIRSSGDQKSLWQQLRCILENSRQHFHRAIPTFDVGGTLAYCDILSQSFGKTENSLYDDEPIVMTISKIDATELKRVNSPIQKRGGVSWALQFRPGLNGTCICIKAYDLPTGAKSVNVKYKIVPSGFNAAAVREYTDPQCSYESSLERLITTHVGNKPLNPSSNVLIEVYIKILVCIEYISA